MSGPPLHLVRAPRELPEGIDELLDAGYRYALSLTHDVAEAEDLMQGYFTYLLERELNTPGFLKKITE